MGVPRVSWPAIDKNRIKWSKCVGHFHACIIHLCRCGMGHRSCIILPRPSGSVSVSVIRVSYKLVGAIIASATDNGPPPRNPRSMGHSPGDWDGWVRLIASRSQEHPSEDPRIQPSMDPIHKVAIVREHRRNYPDTFALIAEQPGSVWSRCDWIAFEQWEWT